MTEAIRGKRGKGKRKKVADNTKLPRDWQSFIKDPSNKVELFYFLSEKIHGVSCPEDKCIYIKRGKCASKQSFAGCGEMQPWNAPSWCISKMPSAKERGNFLVCTVDTDVILFLVGHFHELLVWIAFGMGKSYRRYSINAICDHIGEQDVIQRACFCSRFHRVRHQFNLSWERQKVMLGRVELPSWYDGDIRVLAGSAIRAARKRFPSIWDARKIRRCDRRQN